VIYRIDIETVCEPFTSVLDICPYNLKNIRENIAFLQLHLAYFSTYILSN